MNLKLISDNELIFDLKNLVSEERELLTTILRYLKEVENRKIYLQKGFSSMFAYVTEELGYSEGAAQRRILAMRLLKDLPEVESKIESGEISLSVASQVQSYLRKKEKKAPIKKEEKIALVNSLAGTSSRECERKLIKLSPDTALPREITRPITDEITLIQFLANKDLMKMIQRAKELTSHQNPEGKHDKLFTKALALLIKTIDPAQREARRSKQANSVQWTEANCAVGKGESKSLIHSCGIRPVQSQRPTTVGKALPESSKKSSVLSESPPTLLRSKLRFELRQGNASAVKPKNRHIPNATRDKVWLRDQGRCQFKDKQTGKICGSKKYLELDHRFPFALGGEHSEQSLQLRCRNHNLYRAEILTGSKKYWEKTI